MISTKNPLLIFCLLICLMSAAGCTKDNSEKDKESTLEITVDGIKFRMIAVDGGTFTMGTTPEKDEEAEIWESPEHEVELSDFYIGEFEVTQELWEAIMFENPSYFKGNPDLPVEQVTWEDTQVFIQKLNAKTGKQFSLPTEAQWEFAARGGNKSKGFRFSGSDDIDEVAWYALSENDNKTHPGGEKAPNELGIYDMSGNVYEWCNDVYERYTDGKQINPTGPEKDGMRVIRGGHFVAEAKRCRITDRANNLAESSYYFLGLRLALAR